MLTCRAKTYSSIQRRVIDSSTIDFFRTKSALSAERLCPKKRDRREFAGRRKHKRFLGGKVKVTVSVAVAVKGIYVELRAPLKSNYLPNKVSLLRVMSLGKYLSLLGEESVAIMGIRALTTLTR